MKKHPEVIEQVLSHLYEACVLLDTAQAALRTNRDKNIDGIEKFWSDHNVLWSIETVLYHDIQMIEKRFGINIDDNK